MGEQALPRTAASQRYLLGVWILMSVLTPLLGFLGARGFAPALGVVGALSLYSFRPKGDDWAGFGLLILLAAWAALSALWSPATNLAVHSAKDLGRLTSLHLAMQILWSGAFVVATGRLTPNTAERALRWLSYGLVVLGLILVEEGLSHAGVYQWAQRLIHKPVYESFAVRNVAVGGYVLATLVWPVGTALWLDRRRLVVLFLAAAVIFSTVFLRGDSPSVAIVLSALVFLAVLAWGRAAILGLAAATTAYWLATPWATLALQSSGAIDELHAHVPESWARRLEIWTFTADKWLDHPVRGWGLDASRMFKGFIQLHPHDGAIQIWFELGWPGAVLLAGFWAFLFWRIAKAVETDERLFAAAACATATVYLVIGSISFSLWQEWWIALGALALATCVALRRAVMLKRRPPGDQAAMAQTTTARAA